MNAEQLKHRTKQFALSIINLVEKMSATTSSRIVAHQLAKSGTSVGANYRAVCRARSNKEFIAKMEIVLEEADETLFWLEIIMEKTWLEKQITEPLWIEGNELTAIFVASLKTAKAKSAPN